MVYTDLKVLPDSKKIICVILMLKAKGVENNGTLIWRDKERSYGFVRPDDYNQPEAIFTRNTLEKLGLHNLENKTRVKYYIEEINSKICVSKLSVDKLSAQKQKEAILKFPVFDYYPDPILHDSIIESDLACECCGQSRSYLSSLIYSEYKVKRVCPWCIYDGSAAKRFDGHFNSIFNNISDMNWISDKVYQTITLRTPGFHSWQEQSWLSHCQDGCEYHGVASTTDFEKITPEELDYTLMLNEINKGDWQYFHPDNFHKFICKKCKISIFSFDPD